VFDVIRDFLLEPALITVALLLPAALVLGWLVGVRGAAWAGAVALGEIGTLLAILLGFSASVLLGDERLRALTWGGAWLAWWLAFGWPARLGRRAPWWAAVTTLIAWGLDSYVTSAILFE